MQKTTRVSPIPAMAAAMLASAALMAGTTGFLPRASVGKQPNPARQSAAQAKRARKAARNLTIAARGGLALIGGAQ